LPANQRLRISTKNINVRERAIKTTDTDMMTGLTLSRKPDQS